MINLTIISLFTLLIVLILIRIIYRHDPHGHEQFGNEIVLFHSEERYKKRIFRFHLIEELNELKNKKKYIDGLELKVLIGEFSQESQEIVKHAVNHNFKLVRIISGPKLFCEDITEIYTLLDKYKNVEYFTLPVRPTKHFMIFDNNHLYIEKPHRHNKSRGSVGIKKCNSDLIELYIQTFNSVLKYANPVSKEEILNQPCYKD